MLFNYVFEHVYNDQNSSNTYKGGYAYKPEVDVTPPHSKNSFEVCTN